LKIKRYVILPITLLLLMLIIPIFKTSATSTTMAVDPTNSYVTVNKTLNVNVNVTDVNFLTSWQFTIYFDHTVLNCTNVAEGAFLQSGGSTYFGKTINNNYNLTHGSVLAYSTLLGSTYVNGSGVLATITFTALAVGDSTLHLSDTKLGDQNIPPQPITHTLSDGTAHVQAFTLTVTIVGNGSVTPNNTGPYFHYGEVVSLAATPDIGYSFSSWSGNLSGSTNPGILAITGNMTVTATFTQDQYTLTITISPVGSGSVNKNPDQGTYTYGTNVTLTANANIGWTFSSWSGDAAGVANPTTVNMTGNKAITATFTQNIYTLTTTLIGSGTVTKNGTGSYHYNDVVNLTANPSPGWSFDHWSENLTGSANPTTLTVTGNMFVTATFTQNIYTLTTQVDGNGHINLNKSAPYHYGDIVQFTAVPDTGWTFDHWSNGLTGTSNPTTLTITGDVTVVANFTRNVYTLTINKIGNGNVVNNGTGSLHYGDIVTMNAQADPGWTFNQWSGNLTGSTNPTTLTITSNMIVTATFLQDQYTLSITIVGSGSVDKNPFQATYIYGTIVTLTANPAAGWSFANWTVDISGTTSPTTINMTSNKSVTATFIRNVYTLTINIVGSGTVTRNVTGPYYNYSDTILLSASAYPYWIFHYWSGALTGSVNPATIVMTANSTVTAYFTQKPLVELDPTTRTCRMMGEYFNVSIYISNALNVDDFAFEIHYNATLLTYLSITWNAWGTGAINVIPGVITGHTSGSATSGTFTLMTIRFQATLPMYHPWKYPSNDLNDSIFIQEANVSFPSGPDLRYLRGSLNQVDIGTDFAYTFSPILGDVNNDGTVDLFDFTLIRTYFGAKTGDPIWSIASIYDADNSGTIDIFDLRIIGSNFLFTYVPPS
jgi:Divergent InlB B-repeat domain/Cohesin domain/Dockerin type I domain